MEAPGYEIPEGGVLVQVAAAVPLVRVKNASGRMTRRPRRKVAVFLFTDGPRSTLRKARTKRDEPRFTGDFRISVVLGEAPPVRRSGGRPGLTRSPGVPAAGDSPRSRACPSTDTFSADDLPGVASRLAGEADTLSRLGRQSFLYSGLEPPAELVRSLAEALRPGEVRPSASPAEAAEVVSPPQGDRKAADTVLRLRADPGFSEDAGDRPRRR